jgi:hypothetical protein
MRKFALSFERSELWKRNNDIALVLLRAFKTNYQSDILAHISSFVYTTSIDAKARDEKKRVAKYCCECKGWYVGPCICWEYGGYMPGNPGSSYTWKKFTNNERLRPLNDTEKHLISWNKSEQKER